MDRGYFDLLQELIDLTVDYQLESLLFFHMCQKLFHELPETQIADYRSFIDEEQEGLELLDNLIDKHLRDLYLARLGELPISYIKIHNGQQPIIVSRLLPESTTQQKLYGPTQLSADHSTFERLRKAFGTTPGRFDGMVDWGSRAGSEFELLGLGDLPAIW